MNKLQLYITVSSNGYRNQLEINGDDEVRQHVCDVSVALEDITYNPEEKNIFFLLKYTDKGVFIVVLRTIPRKMADHLAAWIFIPSEISISDYEIEDNVNAVISLVSRKKITQDDYNNVAKIFSKEYETTENYGATAENYGRSYAHRYYGGDTGYMLSDYIGSKRYQTPYLHFAGVILADKDHVTRISGADLTDEPLDQMVKIYPPKIEDSPYHPLIFGQPFDRPYLVPLMGSVEIVWESPSSADVRQSIMVNKPNMRIEGVAAAPLHRPVAVAATTEPEKADTEQPAPAQEEVKPHVAAESFKKAAPTITPAASIPQEPKAPADAEKPAYAPANTAKAEAPKPEPTPTVPATPVAPATQATSQNDSYDNQPRTINFDRQHVYNFEIPAKSAAISGMIRFEIVTRNELNSSPIDGYELSDAIQEGSSRSNHLIYSPTEGVQKRAIWGIVGFVVGMLLMWLCTITFSGSHSHSSGGDEQQDSTIILTAPDADPTAATPAAANVNLPTNVTFEEAIKYLDGNPKWSKVQLEAYPDLRGLYDDLNNFNRERLKSYWGPKLKDSRSFARITDHSEKSLKCKKKPLTSPGVNTYNRPNDTEISVKSYLNWLDP